MASKVETTGMRGGGAAALPLPLHALFGIAVLIAAVAFSTVLGATAAVFVPLWLLGLLVGFTLQRSRFCFASAFRDLFLFGRSHILNGILAGLAVLTAGFALVMFAEVPFPQFGALPNEAHILPVGLSTVIGGVLFGTGMVLAGGCSSGSLYRVGEGYAASAVAVVGMVGGLGLLAFHWNWWWDTLIVNEPRIWLPGVLPGGYASAVAVTFAGLFGVFLLALWWEVRNGFTFPSPVRAASSGADGDAANVGARLRSSARLVFVDGWSPVVGGAVLGVLGVLMYLALQPFGVTGELNRWAQGALSTSGVGPGTLKGLDAIGGCAARAAEGGLFTATFAITVGLTVGSLIAALFAGEFKLRFPRHKRRYVQALGGGVAMGYASGLAIGCTIGAFFSSIPSLGVSGWVFGASLAGGAWLGVKLIQRIP